MRNSRLTASFFAVFAAISGNACGPAESLPPTNDAGVTDDAGDAGDACAGVCAPHVPLSWSVLAFVWVGAQADAPPCSAVAGVSGEFYTGYGDPEGPLCGACKCEAPTGSCELPATLTAAAATCPGDGSGVAHTSFDPPVSWDGTCTTSNAIPAGELCGGTPCVQSVTIAPLTLKQGGCLPVEPTNHPPPTWKTFVRACDLKSFPRDCGTMGGVCSPRLPSAEFRLCTLRQVDSADVECPAAYPDKSVFYDDPVPYCSPCACGVPTDGSCTGSISLFQNSACSAQPFQVVNVDAKGPTCTDVPPGSALGSKTASKPSYSGGSCTPSGGIPPATVICCIP